MRFDIQPTHHESARASSAVLRAALPKGWAASWMVFVIYAIVIVASLIFARQTWGPTMLIGVLASFATFMSIRVSMSVRIASIAANDPHTSELHSVELGPEGIHSWCNRVDARYPWSDFCSIVETREFFAFTRHCGAGIAIPKRLIDASTSAKLYQDVKEWAPNLTPIRKQPV